MITSLFSSSFFFFPKTHTSLPFIAQYSLPLNPPLQPLLHHPVANMSTGLPRHDNNKVVLIIGPTGCGKSKLSIDLATRHFPASEVINNDKIQVHRGLDITTNKMPVQDRKGVPHHLLGEIDGTLDFTAADYRTAASAIITDIWSRRRVPFIVGGSNSYLYALLAKRFDQKGGDVFGGAVFCKEVRYNYCIIWIDVFQPVLNQYLSRRVDEMLDSGMLEELADYFRRPESSASIQCGLNMAIGVPEFRRYFKKVEGGGGAVAEAERRAAYEEAVGAIKENTYELARRQVRKIRRLREEGGWGMHRVEGTAAMRARLEGRRSSAAAEIWEREVVEPSMKVVRDFLM